MMKIGVFFGGQSREREISFAGGKTVMEHIDRSLFLPIPVFVDSLGNFILLKEEYLYQPNIRSFYPPAAFVADSPFSVYVESLGTMSDEHLAKMISSIGQPLKPEDFKAHFEMAFLAMHGPQVEDGAIQGLLEWYGVPYTNSGLMGASIGIDKIAQNQLIQLVSPQPKVSYVLQRQAWQQADKASLFQNIISEVGLPMVIKAPHQGSSIGVSIVREADLDRFIDAVLQCFFIQKISRKEWLKMNEKERHNYLQRLTNVNEGIGMPVVLAEAESIEAESQGTLCYHPQTLREQLDFHFQFGSEQAYLISAHSESQLLIESFVAGKEFSCGVIQGEQGEPIALPPTEIIIAEQGGFDFNAKYQAGGSRKRLPMEASMNALLEVQEKCKAVFQALQFKVCTRIDGFLTADEQVLLHDPNTIPGMSPTSLVFKQFAEIGLCPTQTITYLIHTSLRARIGEGKHTHHYWKLWLQLEQALQKQSQNRSLLPKQSVVLEDSQESLIDARKAHARLAAQGKFSIEIVYKPQNEAITYLLPFSFLLKEDIESVRQAIRAPKHPLLIHTAQQGISITQKYAGMVLGEVQEVKD